MKKISWGAFFAGLFTDIGIHIVQLIITILIFVFLRSVFLTYTWYFLSEIVVAGFVGYVIGKVAKKEPLLNALFFYVIMLVLTSGVVSLLPEENWTHVSSLWAVVIQALELIGLSVGALIAKE